MRVILLTLLYTLSDAFIPRGNNRQRYVSVTSPNLLLPPAHKKALNDHSRLTLFAKKKKGNAKSAALDALDVLEEQLDLNEPLSKKEQKQLLKQQKKDAAKLNNVDGDSLTEEDPNDDIKLKTQQQNESKPMSKKEKMLAKALALDSLDAEPSESSMSGNDQNPQLSKKELKALKKKEEKMAAKGKKKIQKLAEKEAQNVDNDLNSGEGESKSIKVGATNNDTTAEIDVQKLVKVTLEDKIRKERPPPRIRVMESAQPGFVSLRLQNVGITFRNQEVLKDVTWGVQSGDRIGLVGKNGAGKTTQLRILANELEPTTGDVIKSSMELRTAMLRQEFVDELVKERTLKEEFMSVFEEETKIIQDLKDAESKLETMSDANSDEMQEILDRMQDLQQKAEDKNVLILESRVKKTMDLMGFSEDEGDDLVASFSGGWKMRIGLGKVLLKEPNVLLLGESRTSIYTR